MKSLKSFSTGQGQGKHQSHVPPVAAPTGGSGLTVQSTRKVYPHYPFQPLPEPNGPAPYRYDLSQLLSAGDVNAITSAGVLVAHFVGDTGDYRGQQQDFVAAMLTQDAQNSPAGKTPAFFYHLGDVVYFAGDVDKYAANFYETYKDYPGFIVAIPGNHDCQPDDPLDGPVDPNKKPLDGWVQNFMAANPGQLGSLQTGSGRTQLDLPNVYWTFTTPFATIIGLFSNVSETQGEFHQDQIDWFVGELKAANPKLPLLVTVHHPPFSGDTDHSGSTVVDKVLFSSFKSAGRYPDLILSGHVHNYQRFTNTVEGPDGTLQIPCIVAGAGGYTTLGKLPKINGSYPGVPLPVSDTLTLEQYDHNNFGFLRLEISKTQIVGSYWSAPYSAGSQPEAQQVDAFVIDVVNNTVQTVAVPRSS